MPQSDIAGFYPGLSRFSKPWETVITPAATMVTPQRRRGNTGRNRGQPGKTGTSPDGFKMFKTIGGHRDQPGHFQNTGIDVAKPWDRRDVQLDRREAPFHHREAPFLRRDKPWSSLDPGTP